MWPPFCLTTSCKRTLAFVRTFRHKSSGSARHNFTMWALSCATFSGLFWHPKEARKGQKMLVTLNMFFIRNSFPAYEDVKCFCNNKNVLRAQSMVWHFVRHPVYLTRNLNIGTSRECYSGDQDKKMRWAGHVERMRREMYTVLWWANLKDRGHLQYVNVDVRIILK